MTVRLSAVTCMAGLTGIRMRLFARMGRTGRCKGPGHGSRARQNRLADAMEAELDIERIVSMLGEFRH
jgi:hypothetical protein